MIKSTKILAHSTSDLKYGLSKSSCYSFPTSKDSKMVIKEMVEVISSMDLGSQIYSFYMSLESFLISFCSSSVSESGRA